MTTQMGACVTDEGGALMLKHYQRLLNVEFPWDEEYLGFENPWEGPPCRIKRDLVEKAICKMNDGKAAGW